MKRIITFIFAVIFAFTTVTANAADVEFLSEIYNNYTAEYDMSVSFESSDDIVQLLEEIKIPEEIGNFADIKSLLKSLLSLEAKMLMQADISEDYKDIKLAITADMQQTVDVNKNLNIGVNSKTGMWINLSLSGEKPVYEIIYSLPVMNKYMRMDIFELMTNEDEKQQMLDLFSKMLNKEYVEEMQKLSAELVKKYAEIKMSGSKCTVRIDNDALISMIDEIMPVIFETINELVPEDAYYLSDEELPSFEGLQFLGEEGITYTYSLLSGKISKVDMSADVSVDISKIAEEAAGVEWMYEAKGILDFKIESKAKMSQIGKTEVEFPELTQDNSVNMADLLQPQADMPAEFEYVPEYPSFYVDGMTEKMPVIDGKIYVPLRNTIVSAYGDTAVIEYENGVIAVKCEYFPGFAELKLKTGSEEAYLDGVLHNIDRVIVEDGTSYVSTETFTGLFGWEMAGAQYDMIGKIYSYYFYTMS